MAMAAGAGIEATAQGLMQMAGDLWSAKQAKKQRKWAKKMYEQRYQMTMADMRKAGLNPLLAGAMGAGSVPSGAMASVPPRLPIKPYQTYTEAKERQARTSLEIAQGGQAQETSARLRAERHLLEQKYPRAEAEAELWRKIGPYGAAAKELLPWAAGGAGVAAGAKGLSKMLGKKGFGMQSVMNPKQLKELKRRNEQIRRNIP